ncbi:MAG: hypothetical protein WC043_06015 [Pseudobdellovibrionaceae bacterium]
MSYHVYVAYNGFKETPIAPANFQAAVKACPELSVPPKTESFRTAWLKEQKRQRLHLTVYGLIDAQAPSEDLIHVMFKIAKILGARVYSERLKPYDSPEDWEKRTRTYRQKTEAARQNYRRQKNLRLLLWISFITACLVIGWMTGGK